MGSSQEFNPTLISESSEMLTEEKPRVDSEASQNFSEVLVKNLRGLSLDPGTKLPSPLPEDLPQQRERREKTFQDLKADPPYRRRGVRTLLSVQKEKLIKLRYLLLNRFSDRLSPNEPRSQPFKCGCSFCVSYRWDPSENARIGNYDTELTSP
ncbi:developmental pluripotency-associated protein 3 [Carlito syrichta]|uniref:Developmental pluripotency-associated protein 3 n=1 Tax=Carlito syrichta TaxID=1868482 RepID=A0A3Q0DNL4_CARSF|nr:developmental pluripotency-associated protein 3 [Carlito syrichta]